MKLYRLVCCAPWTTDALAVFFGFFQENALNVHRLMMIEAFDDPTLSKLEVQFMLPDQEQEASTQKLLEGVRNSLSVLPCRYLQLNAL